MTERKKSNLSRPIYPVPGFVEEALRQHGFTEAYFGRPANQQNDFIDGSTAQ